ncbi:hypothetical protein LXL04_031756 [Taraxacum kok-saghyz]
MFTNPSVQKHSKKAKISWIQYFLAGVPFIVVGYRDDSSRLVRTERLRTKDMTHRVKIKNYWQVKTINHLLKLPICPISLK